MPQQDDNDGFVKYLLEYAAEHPEEKHVARVHPDTVLQAAVNWALAKQANRDAEQLYLSTVLDASSSTMGLAKETWEHSKRTLSETEWLLERFVNIYAAQAE